MVAPLFAERDWIGRLFDSLPPFVRDGQFLELFLWQWLGLLLLTVAALLVGTLAQRLIRFLVRPLVGRGDPVGDEAVLESFLGPVRWAMTAVLIYSLFPLLDLSEGARAWLDPIIRIVVIVVGTWLLTRLTTLAAALLERYLVRQTTNPSHQRSIRTQITVPLSVLRFLIVVLGVALVLIQFDLVRSVGVSMLASAGVAGVVVGLAAQRTVANLLAGIQLAIFQPIRIGDAVVVEGEYGTVEEIGLTYVVIRVWNDRRLILPVSYFLEKPFQNWSRQSPDLIGTVIMQLDFLIPVEEVRAELSAILAAAPLWDKRVQSVQVTGLTMSTVELRILVSAADGQRLWDLRCHVREKLWHWLQTRAQASLPVRK